MKKIKIYFLIPTLVLFLTGCWDRVEVNDLAFVIASGADRTDDNKYRVTVQVPLPSALGGAGSNGGGGGTSGGNPFYVDAGIGRNMREANENLQTRMPRRIYYAHNRVMVLGENLAKEGFQAVLNVIIMQPESRLSTFLLICKGNANDLLTTKPQLEKLPGEAIREMAKTSLGKTIVDVLLDMERPGKDAVVPFLELKKVDNKTVKEKEYDMESFAVMKGDRFSFSTNRKESQGILWLFQKMRGKSMTFSTSKEKELSINTVESNSKINLTFKRGMPFFTVNIKAAGIVMENESNLDLEDQEVYRKVVSKMQAQIKDQVTAILTHAHSEGIDVNGFGWYIYKNENKQWQEKWEKNWEQTLKTLDFEVKVDAEIQRLNAKGLQIEG